MVFADVIQHAGDVLAWILNPNSGVGQAFDPNYAALATSLKTAGIKVIGYISTLYGERPMEQIKSEINRWSTWYKADGVFADEMSGNPEFLAYYRRIRGAIGSGLLVANPGTVPDKAYLDLDAIICIAETDQEAYLGKTFPDWVKNAPKNRFYHICYGVTDPAKVQAKIDANNAEFFYMASVPGPDPQFSVETSVWPVIQTAPPASPRMLSTCTTDQLLEEVRKRIEQ